MKLNLVRRVYGLFVRGRFVRGRFVLDCSSGGRFVMRTVRPADGSSGGGFVRRTVHPEDGSFAGLFVQLFKILKHIVLYTCGVARASVPPGAGPDFSEPEIFLALFKFLSRP